MTKRVRIENADTSDHKVIVQVWDKNHLPGEPDFLVKEIPLTYPTTMAEEYIHSSRYLVIKEA